MAFQTLGAFFDSPGTFLNARLACVALELPTLLCTFQYSTKCSKILFDFDSFSEWLLKDHCIIFHFSTNHSNYLFSL